MVLEMNEPSKNNEDVGNTNVPQLEKVTCAIEQAVPTVVKLVGKENVNHEDTATAEEMKKVNFAPTVEGVNVSSLDSPQWDQSTNNQREESEEELKTREEIKIKSEVKSEVKKLVDAERKAEENEEVMETEENEVAYNVVAPADAVANSMEVVPEKDVDDGKNPSTKVEEIQGIGGSTGISADVVPPKMKNQKSFEEKVETVSAVFIVAEPKTPEERRPHKAFQVVNNDKIEGDDDRNLEDTANQPWLREKPPEILLVLLHDQGLIKDRIEKEKLELMSAIDKAYGIMKSLRN